MSSDSDVTDPNFPILVGEYEGDDPLLFSSNKLGADYVTVHIPDPGVGYSPRCGETLTSEDSEWELIPARTVQTEDMPEFPTKERGTQYRLCSRCRKILEKPPRYRSL